MSILTTDEKGSRTEARPPAGMHSKTRGTSALAPVEYREMGIASKLHPVAGDRYSLRRKYRL
jgi:hypothetical protein